MVRARSVGVWLVLAMAPWAWCQDASRASTEEPIAPLRQLPRYFLQDQKAIWTSPFHTSRKNAVWWGVFGAATGVLIATDKRTSRELPNTPDQAATSR